MDDAAIIE